MLQNMVIDPTYAAKWDHHRDVIFVFVKNKSGRGLIGPILVKNKEGGGMMLLKCQKCATNQGGRP